MRSILILLNSVSSNIFEAIFIPFFFAPALARSRLLFNALCSRIFVSISVSLRGRQTKETGEADIRAYIAHRIMGNLTYENVELFVRGKSVPSSCTANPN